LVWGSSSFLGRAGMGLAGRERFGLFFLDAFLKICWIFSSIRLFWRFSFEYLWVFGRYSWRVLISLGRRVVVFWR
jgi:hypothetical protein